MNDEELTNLTEEVCKLAKIVEATLGRLREADIREFDRDDYSDSNAYNEAIMHTTYSHPLRSIGELIIRLEKL